MAAGSELRPAPEHANLEFSRACLRGLPYNTKTKLCFITRQPAKAITEDSEEVNIAAYLLPLAQAVCWFKASAAVK